MATPSTVASTRESDDSQRPRLSHPQPGPSLLSNSPVPSALRPSLFKPRFTATAASQSRLATRPTTSVSYGAPHSDTVLLSGTHAPFNTPATSLNRRRNPFERLSGTAFDEFVSDVTDRIKHALEPPPPPSPPAPRTERQSALAASAPDINEKAADVFGQVQEINPPQQRQPKTERDEANDSDESQVPVHPYTSTRQQASSLFAPASTIEGTRSPSPSLSASVVDYAGRHDDGDNHENGLSYESIDIDQMFDEQDQDGEVVDELAKEEDVGDGVEDSEDVDGEFLDLPNDDQEYEEHEQVEQDEQHLQERSFSREAATPRDEIVRKDREDPQHVSEQEIGGFLSELLARRATEEADALEDVDNDADGEDDFVGRGGQERVLSRRDESALDPRLGNGTSSVEKEVKSPAARIRAADATGNDEDVDMIELSSSSIDDHARDQTQYVDELVSEDDGMDDRARKRDTEATHVQDGQDGRGIFAATKEAQYQDEDEDGLDGAGTVVATQSVEDDEVVGTRIPYHLKGKQRADTPPSEPVEAADSDDVLMLASSEDEDDDDGQAQPLDRRVMARQTQQSEDDEYEDDSAIYTQEYLQHCSLDDLKVILGVIVQKLNDMDEEEEDEQEELDRELERFGLVNKWYKKRLAEAGEEVSSSEDEDVSEDDEREDEQVQSVRQVVFDPTVESGPEVEVHGHELEAQADEEPNENVEFAPSGPVQISVDAPQENDLIVEEPRSTSNVDVVLEQAPTPGPQPSAELAPVEPEDAPGTPASLTILDNVLEQQQQQRNEQEMEQDPVPPAAGEETSLAPEYSAIYNGPDAVDHPMIQEALANLIAATNASADQQSQPKGDSYHQHDVSAVDGNDESDEQHYNNQVRPSTTTTATSAAQTALDAATAEILANFDMTLPNDLPGMDFAQLFASQSQVDNGLAVGNEAFAGGELNEDVGSTLMEEQNDGIDGDVALKMGVDGLKELPLKESIEVDTVTEQDLDVVASFGDVGQQKSSATVATDVDLDAAGPEELVDSAVAPAVSAEQGLADDEVAEEPGQPLENATAEPEQSLREGEAAQDSTAPLAAEAEFDEKVFVVPGSPPRIHDVLEPGEWNKSTPLKFGPPSSTAALADELSQTSDVDLEAAEHMSSPSIGDEQQNLLEEEEEDDHELRDDGQPEAPAFETVLEREISIAVETDGEEHDDLMQPDEILSRGASLAPSVSMQDEAEAMMIEDVTETALDVLQQVQNEDGDVKITVTASMTEFVDEEPTEETFDDTQAEVDMGAADDQTGGEIPAHEAVTSSVDELPGHVAEAAQMSDLPRDVDTEASNAESNLDAPADKPLPGRVVSVDVQEWAAPAMQEVEAANVAKPPISEVKDVEQSMEAPSPSLAPEIEVDTAGRPTPSNDDATDEAEAHRQRDIEFGHSLHWKADTPPFIEEDDEPHIDLTDSPELAPPPFPGDPEDFEPEELDTPGVDPEAVHVPSYVRPVTLDVHAPEGNVAPIAEELDVVAPVDDVDIQAARSTTPGDDPPEESTTPKSEPMMRSTTPLGEPSSPLLSQQTVLNELEEDEQDEERDVIVEYTPRGEGEELAQSQAESVTVEKQIEVTSEADERDAADVVLVQLDEEPSDPPQDSDGANDDAAQASMLSSSPESGPVEAEVRGDDNFEHVNEVRDSDVGQEDSQLGHADDEALAGDDEVSVAEAADEDESIGDGPATRTRSHAETAYPVRRSKRLLAATDALDSDDEDDDDAVQSSLVPSSPVKRPKFEHQSSVPEPVAVKVTRLEPSVNLSRSSRKRAATPDLGVGSPRKRSSRLHESPIQQPHQHGPGHAHRHTRAKPGKGPLTRNNCGNMKLKIRSLDQRGKAYIFSVPSCALNAQMEIGQKAMELWKPDVLGEDDGEQEGQIVGGGGVGGEVALEDDGADIVPDADVRDALRRIVGADLWHEGAVELLQTVPRGRR
ncbi:hypothetical protein ACM66B_003367 [Microbotryomycetes sp. NB124-2]